MRGIESLLVASVMMASACTTTDPGSSEGAVDQGTPLASVSLSNGDMVTFTEIAPAVIDIGQLAPIGVAPVDTKLESAVQVFQSIAPGETVPAALLAAQARVDAARAGRKPVIASTTANAKSGTPVFTPRITDTEFTEDYCANDGGPWENVRCHEDVAITRSGIAENVDAFRVAVCVNSGQVQVNIRIEGTSHLSQDLESPLCSWHQYNSGLSNFDDFQDEVDVLKTGTDYDEAVLWNN
jgi:hypothetical protein